MSGQGLTCCATDPFGVLAWTRRPWLETRHHLIDEATGPGGCDLIGTCRKQLPHRCFVRPSRHLVARFKKGTPMSRMTVQAPAVIGGVDTHVKSHHAAVIDLQGHLLGVCSFPTTDDGYRQLLAWMREFGPLQTVGVEGSGAYGAALTRYLRAAAVTVVEVNRPHAHTRARRGKSDAVDAEAAARKVLSGECTTVPKDTTGIVEAIRQLHLVRASAVEARTIALQQLHALIITAPEPIRHGLTAKTLKGKATQCASWTVDPNSIADPVQAARHALGSLGRRIRDLNAEIRTFDKHLSTLVKKAAPRTLSRYGVGVMCTAQMLITAGQNIERLHGETSFAHLCGSDPLPASSGQTERHRLNYGGDRQANRALYMTAVVRLRGCQRTREYAARRRAEGKSTKDIIRCLKRYIAREIYYTLTTDLKNLAAAT